ncbi:hypothetical protein GCM10009609_66850 [Pseudonocardia aurantiaca]
MPLDDLIGALRVADPRVQTDPRRVAGRTVPLTRQPGPLQAFKITIPATKIRPEPRTNGGYGGCSATAATASRPSVLATRACPPETP